MKKQRSDYTLPTKSQIALFVKESEAITGEPDEAITNRHLEIVECVAKADSVIHPYIIHHGLFNGLNTVAGKYRTGVRGGKEHEMPPGKDTDKLLKAWIKDAERKLKEFSNSPKKIKRQVVKDLYFDFLITEPFVDGNGRVARIMRLVLECKFKLPFKPVTIKTISSERSELRKRRKKFMARY